MSFCIAYPLFLFYGDIRIDYTVLIVNLLLNIITIVAFLILVHYLLHDNGSNISYIIIVPLVFILRAIRVYIAISLIDDTL